MGFFQLIGALISWLLSGFKGELPYRLENEINPKQAYVGLGFVILTVLLVVLIIRFSSV
jgi:hypothetical protein